MTRLTQPLSNGSLTFLQPVVMSHAHPSKRWRLEPVEPIEMSCAQLVVSNAKVKTVLL